MTASNNTHKKAYEYHANLASDCQNVAYNLSYNDSPIEAKAKLILVEASHALDSCAVRVHKKRDGLLLVNARGKSRFMSLRERIAYWLLRGATEIKP